ncbi:hypothetical protein OBBRIDRAFT_793139 [Obba rivulosa]|uniref:Uncharacterized protein n=1 Tax=Obba rivulosa TaxID=1052685 RepID=A0A8E2B3D6_9APHY|nr:hypothetical protein OBBRIDRAFT_793139 [Obba rivulosa]
MPFLSDNAWPAGLRTIFEHCGAEYSAFENRYYGPYDKLLNYCFGESFTYYVAPQSSRDDGGDAVDFIVSFVVFGNNDKPVLVEAKGDAWAGKAELRHRAADA